MTRLQANRGTLPRVAFALAAALFEASGEATPSIAPVPNSLPRLFTRRSMP